MSGKYGRALGIWNITVDEANIEVKPIKGDNRKLLKIMMDEKYKNDAALRMESFMDWLINIIKRDNPDDDPVEIDNYVEFNINSLFEETLVAFRWTTKDEMDKSRKEALGDIKKSIGGALANSKG